MIKPPTKVVQSDLGSQTSPEARQVMGALWRQPKGVEQFVIDALDHLAQAGQRRWARLQGCSHLVRDRAL